MAKKEIKVYVSLSKYGAGIINIDTEKQSKSDIIGLVKEEFKKDNIIWHDEEITDIIDTENNITYL